jgi:propionyl-CoA synthetase
VGTPDASTFWRIVEEYKVNTLFTAPTALRAIRRDDPDNDFIGDVGRRGGIKSLRALFLAGERSEPSIVQMYQHLLEKYGAEDALVVDNWWSSESGSPITGLAQLASTGLDFGSKEKCESLRMKPGSAGKPMPGFDVKIVDDEGKEVENGKMGNIVLGIPLAPTGMTTLWNDEERFYRGYLKRFDGKFIDTGDAGMIDEDGSSQPPPHSAQLVKSKANVNRICPCNVPRRRHHKRSRSPFLHRRNRTSHPLPPLHRRSMRYWYP